MNFSCLDLLNNSENVFNDFDNNLFDNFENNNSFQELVNLVRNEDAPIELQDDQVENPVENPVEENELQNIEEEINETHNIDGPETNQELLFFCRKQGSVVFAVSNSSSQKSDQGEPVLHIIAVPKENKNSQNAKNQGHVFRNL